MEIVVPLIERARSEAYREDKKDSQIAKCVSRPPL
jgi:hypothetical protein